MTQPPLDKSEFEAALSARKELGEQMEPELVESFASKVVAEIRRQQAQAPDGRVPRGSLTPSQQARSDRRNRSYSPMALAIVSMVLAVPLTAISLSIGGFFMGLVAWACILGINVAAAFGAFTQQR